MAVLHPVDQRRWTDTALSPGERADALLAAMSLEEKVAQLGSVWKGFAVEATGDVAPMQEVFAAGSRPFDDAVRYGLGQLTRVFGTRPVTVEEGRARVVELQRAVMSGSRFGIPAIVHEECLTGFTTLGATVYPTSLAWAATFDPALVERMSAAIGADMRAVGVQQGLSPVLDVVRDYRWGRVEETMGEDPYLVAMLGSAYVRGLEQQGIVATLKHFVGYSASRAARNHAPVAMGPRELREIMLVPFETAIRSGGARSVMNSYTDIDGVPVGADPALLTGVLRDEWGFEGTVVSDYWSVPFLESMHRVAASPAEAGALALAAGIDVELPDAIGFHDGLIELVRAGRVPEELVDRAARRVLRQKAELGLLDPDWTPRRPSPRATASTSTRRATGPSPASSPRRRSCCSPTTPACCRSVSAPPRAGSPSWDPAPTTRRRSWAATPTPTTSSASSPSTGSAWSRTRCGRPCALNCRTTP
ncbi:hypothetical protein Asp14428_02230 [Actinoplanes sp. NBRC 14428]|nr:hypothetical protein Asp14428_02230 [Actinoplanes sp. NBRC 14428]